MVASRKRKREYVGGDDDDGDDDATYGLRQTLPVANLPIDFDGEPTDGLQYLFTVRYVLSITLSRDNDGMTSTGEMHGDYPTSSTSTTLTHSALHGLLSPSSSLCPNPHKMWRHPRHSQAKNGAANSSIAFETSVV